MRHLDLFSGIGGFALAASWVWGEQYETIAFCDNDQFCQQVLKKNFPGTPVFGDIRTISADPRGEKHRRSSGNERKAISEARRGGVDLLTGGFPCQPFSHAGRRKGTEDDRYLWPEMLRVIREFRPRWVLGENVAGFVTWNEGMVLRQVFSDLESEGYEVQAFVIPACAVNAPHRRDRIWIVAHALNDGQRGTERKGNGTQEEISGEHRQKYSTAQKPSGTVEIRRGKGHDEKPFSADPAGAGLEREKHKAGSHSGLDSRAFHRRKRTRLSKRSWSCARTIWNKNWIEVATELCGVDDGLPAELDGFKLSEAGHRNARFKSLGNAIVPQLAAEIFKAIEEVMNPKVSTQNNQLV